jgi:hypothetical protein
MRFLTLLLCAQAAAWLGASLKQPYGAIPYDEDLSRHCALLSSAAYGLDSEVCVYDVFLHSRAAVATCYGAC